MKIHVVLSANRAANYLIAKARISGGIAYEVFTHLDHTLVVPIIEYIYIAASYGVSNLFHKLIEFKIAL